MTLTRPVVAPNGTVTRNALLDSTVRRSTGVPLKVTAVALARFVPPSVTNAPTAAAPGDSEVSVGGRITRKSAGLTDCPSGVTTVMRPVIAVTGTVATTSPALIGVKAAAMPPKRTIVAPASVVPVIETFAPGKPRGGENPVTRGAT